ncbi:MAG: type II secretion system protein [Alphaproteobacteria bacterium]|nr:type II secretion system protein [Alphaproteobacteria bacterium]
MRRRTRGFSLVELAMVVAISGLMVGFALQSQQTTGMGNCYESSRIQLQDIRGAVERFARVNGRLPLPAARNAGVEAVTYGREAASPALIDATGGASFGALPFQALGLNSSYAGDCWGNKFTYVVTTALTTGAGYSNTNILGNIALKSSTTTTVNNSIAYAVISHGQDALGAVKLNYTAASHGWCTGATLKHLNCNKASATVAGAGFNNGKNAGANYFDDVIIFGGKPQWVVNGACNNAVALGCSAGSAISDNGQTACGTTRQWVCQGMGGGTNSGTCSFANAACVPLVNGACNNSVTFACSAGTSTSNVAGSCGGNATWTCSGSGGGTNANCSKANAACASCALPWGGSLASGSSVLAYQTSSVTCGNSCVSQSRTCTNGSLSGSYTNASCSVGTCAVNGACNNSVTFACSAGTSTSNVAGVCGGNATWTCSGSGGGTNASCSKANAACVVNGVCGGSGGSCSAGTVGLDNNETACGTTRSWTCNGSGGGTNATCDLANAACAPVVNGVCNNTTTFACSAGTSASNVAGVCGGNATWSCNGSGGGTNATNCSKANAACAVNGVCNNATTFACSAGTSTSNVAGVCGGNATWTCSGSGGGTNASCSKANAACPVNGSCSTTAGACTAGTATGDNGLTACGTTRSWTCNGSGGGSNASCSIANAACPVNGVCDPSGGCVSGTYQLLFNNNYSCGSNPYSGAGCFHGGCEGFDRIYNCLGSNGGTSQNNCHITDPAHWDGSPCCGAYSC